MGGPTEGSEQETSGKWKTAPDRRADDDAGSGRSERERQTGSVEHEGSGGRSGKDEDEIPQGLRRFFGGSWEETTRSSGAAYGLVGGILGLGFLGWLADRYFGTAHRWLLVGLLVGGVAGFYRLGRTMLSRR